MYRYRPSIRLCLNLFVNWQCVEVFWVPSRQRDGLFLRFCNGSLTTTKLACFLRSHRLYSSNTQWWRFVRVCVVGIIVSMVLRIACSSHVVYYVGFVCCSCWIRTSLRMCSWFCAVLCPSFPFEWCSYLPFRKRTSSVCCGFFDSTTDHRTSLPLQPGDRLGRWGVCLEDSVCTGSWSVLDTKTREMSCAKKSAGDVQVKYVF